MRRIAKKLRGRRGETLIETLVALLVAVMASALLLTMTSTASRMNTMAMVEDEYLFQETNAAQRQQSGGKYAEVRMEITGAAGDVTTIDQTVFRYGGADEISSYRMAGEEAAP